MLISYLKMTFFRILRSYVIQQWTKKIKVVSLFLFSFHERNEKLFSLINFLS